MSSYGVVHLLQPNGNFLRIEIALPPTYDNGNKHANDLYQWVYERLLEEKVETAQAMQDPFLVCTSHNLKRNRASLAYDPQQSECAHTDVDICSSQA